MAAATPTSTTETFSHLSSTVDAKTLALSGQIYKHEYVDMLQYFKADNPQNPFIPLLATYHDVLELPLSDNILYDTSDEKAKKIREEEILWYGNYLSRTTLGAWERFLCEKQMKDITVFEDITIAAEKIDCVQRRHGIGSVLFLGRSPCVIQLVYEDFLKRGFYKSGLEISYPDISGHVLHLSFSGTPDISNTRLDPHFSKDLVKTNARNLVTPEKLSFYCDYMDSQKMDVVGEKLYIVDIIGSGGGLNSFLRIAHYYYKTHLGRPAPQFHIIALNLDYVRSIDTPIFKHDRVTQLLSFKNAPSYGVVPFQVPLSPLQMAYGALNYFLDNNGVQTYATHGAEFPAQRWRTESLPALKTGGFYHELFYKLIRPKFCQILKRHALEYASK